MKKKNRDERSALSREWMCTALLQLMANRPFNRISITEITKKAGVSRITFYRHYQSKEDIFIKKLDTIFEEFYTSTKPHWSSPDYTYQASTVAFRFVAENENLVLKMVDAGISHLIIDKLKKAFMKMFVVNNENDHYYTHFLAGGIFATIIEWINRNHDRTPEDMALFLSTVSGSNDILTQKSDTLH